MKTLAFALVAAICAAGCSKKAAEGGGACEAAIGSALDRMTAARAGSAMPGEMQQMVTKLKGVIVKRCTEDKWPADVIDCYAKSGNMAEVRTCRNKLAPELSSKLMNDEMQIMSGMMGGPKGPMPMHGAPPPPVPPPGPATPAAPTGNGSAAPPAGSGSGS